MGFHRLENRDYQHKTDENDDVFGSELNPDGNIRVVQEPVHHGRPPKGQEDGNREAHQRKQQGLQDSTAEYGGLRGANQSPCSHLPRSFCTECHVQVDVVEYCTDEQKQHRCKQQVQRPFVAVCDISRDEGAALRIPEYQLIHPVYPDALQEGRAVSVV